MAHTVEEIYEIIDGKLSDLTNGVKSYIKDDGKYAELYQTDCVNYRSKISVGKVKKLFTEIIAEHIIHELDAKRFDMKYLATFYDKSKLRGGNAKYRFNFEHKLTEKNKMTEKVVCHNLYKNGFENETIGKISEYEVNLVLGSKKNIDLISINHKTKTIYIIEVKGNLLKNQNEETLLRCILEIETYYQILNKVKDEFLCDLKLNGYEIKKAILLFEGENTKNDSTRAWEDYIKAKDYDSFVYKLLTEKLGIEVISFTEKDVKDKETIKV